jgi:hypothetical protein
VTRIDWRFLAGDGAYWEAGFDVMQTKRHDATTFSGRMQVP